MKKLLITILFTLILSGNTFAEQYRVAVSGYYDETKSTLNGKSKVSLEAAKDEALRLCKSSNLMNKGKPESCLVYRIVIHKDGLFGKLIKDEIVWSKEVAKFEKKLEQKKIAEKPKKQEPENNQKEKGLQLKQTLLQSTLVMKSKKNTHTVEFNINGTGTWSMGDYSRNIVWEVIDNNTFKAHQPKYNYSLAKINWKNLTLKYEDSRGEIWDYKIISPKKLVTLIAEKPKKQKPKKQTPDPDDNKIVPAGSGSGFFVLKDGTVITNYHVIEGCELNKVSYKGSQSEAKVLSIDKVNDIAILKTNINPQTAFSVSNEDVSLLEDVVVAGYPLGKQISSAIKTHKGVVTALAGAGDNYSYFQTDAAINQGNSGGPIINQKGNVVGIAVQTWIEEGVQGVHFGIKSSTLKTFASANGLKFLAPNNRDLSNKELGKLITESTVYVECHMTIAKIKKMLAEMENKKAFFKEYK